MRRVVRTSASASLTRFEARPVLPRYVTFAVAVRYCLPRESEETVPSQVNGAVQNSLGSYENSCSCSCSTG